MNKFVKGSIYFLLIGGVVLLILPVDWFPSFYDVRYMGWMALISSALIFFLPSLIFPPKKALAPAGKNYAFRWLQSFLAFAFVSNALGDLGLYKLYQYGFEYDKLLHFVTPLLAAMTFSFVLNERWGVRPFRAALISFFVIVTIGVGWEVYEYLADFFLKTHISGIYGANISADTKSDLLFDFLGALIGAIGWLYLRRVFSQREKSLTAGQ